METDLYALKVSLMGMGTTFTILTLLWLSIHFFEYIFKKTALTPADAVLPGEEKVKEAVQNNDEISTGELIAVIASASHYAAARWNRPAVVKAVIPDRKNNVSPWANAARHELINLNSNFGRAQ